MNLIGHVALALAEHPDAPEPFLVGCMVPDVAAIARVRLARAAHDELAEGIAFHHATDRVFHELGWFVSRVRVIRDELVGHGVPRGAARACAHAGLEMVLDGALATSTPQGARTRPALRALARMAPALGALVDTGSRARFVEVASRLGRDLDGREYANPMAVAERLVRATAGRRRIELDRVDAPVVAATLAGYARTCSIEAADVLAAVGTSLRCATGR